MPAFRLPPAAGVCFKPQHWPAIAATAQAMPFFEVHAENYMGAGGPPHAQLGALRERHAISIHGVGLSLGGATAPDRDHLARLGALCARYEPAAVSEHVAWSCDGGAHLGDLLPLPYTEEALRRIVRHVDQVQSALGRTILVENPSTYLRLAAGDIPEPQFLGALAGGSGCGLLLDLNNLHVSAANCGFDAAQWLGELPLHRVAEIHLAGHARTSDDDGAPLLVDDHGSSIDSAVLALLDRVVAWTGPLPTLVEWDNDIPEWPVLAAEASRAQAILDRAAIERAA